jgi:hypothetical protein
MPLIPFVIIFLTGAGPIPPPTFPGRNPLTLYAYLCERYATYYH